jgi:hypothetical protein
VEAPTPAAPAQPTPLTPTAVDAAVVEGDVSAFRDARRAERQGKPLATPAPVESPAPTEDDDLPTPLATAAAAPLERPVSKRQQQINDYERRIAEQTAEITRLKAAPAPPPAAPAPPKPAAPAAAPVQADYEKYLAHPDAPKQDKFDSFEKWTAAMSVFIADQRYAEREQAAQTRADGERQQQHQQQRLTGYQERMKAAKTADPEFLTKLSEDVKALKPFAALEPGEQPSALNAIADEILDSDVAPQLLLHFSEHPDDLRRLSALAPRELLREFGRLSARFDQSEAPAAPVAKTKSDAPPPPTTFGSRPTTPTDPLDAAVASGDVAAFRAAKRANLAAART